MAKQHRKRGTARDKTICLPLANDLDYATFVEDSEVFRQYLDKQIAAHPELFPEGIEAGYRFHGWVKSSRQQIKTRQILLPRTKEAYQLRPDFVMPYMSETAEMADKALYLRNHGLSFEGIAYVLGALRDALVSALSVVGASLHCRDYPWLTDKTWITNP